MSALKWWHTYERMNALPSQLVELILNRLTINGAVPITTEDIRVIFVDMMSSPAGQLSRCKTINTIERAVDPIVDG